MKARPAGPGRSRKWLPVLAIVVVVSGCILSAAGQTTLTVKPVEGSVEPRAKLVSLNPDLRLSAAAANAVRTNPGFRAIVIPANDDGSGPLTPIGFTLSFFGISYSQLFVNNNGNLTFDEDLATFTPFDLTAARRVIIAPFFGDVDTRGAASQLVTYGVDTVDGRRAFGANYVNVGYYNTRTDKINSFQVILIDRSDVGPGDFDIEFNYNTIQWETGEASGGVDGLGGNPARVGYSNGTGNPGTFFELPGSAESGAFLDSNALNGLANNSLNSDVTGRYVYQVRSGFVQTVDLSVTSAAFPSTVQAGNELRYVITVRNTGQVPAEGVQLRTSVPPGVIFVSATTSNGACRGGAAVVCTLGAIPVGGNATVTVTVIPTAAGLLNTSSTVFSFQPDSNNTNNRAPATNTRVTCDGPAIRYISPSRVRAGSGEFKLYVNGICFGPEALLRFNGQPRPTTVTDSTVLSATISANDVANAGNVQVTVFSDLRQSAAAQFVVTSGDTGIATITPQGVVNAAGFAQRGTTANTILSIFGSNLASQTASASSLPLPTTLGGVVVRVNSYAAPLLYVSPQQINFVLPWEVLGLSEVVIAVSGGGLTSNAQVLTQAVADPGIFTTGPSGQGAIVIAATGELAAPAGSVSGRAARPARRGEFLSIFATGLGPARSQPASGAAAPAGTGSRTIFLPTVTIDGVEVPADFSGLAPGFSGLYQVNVQVPATQRSGSAIPVKIVINGIESNTVTIAVE